MSRCQNSSIITNLVLERHKGIIKGNTTYLHRELDNLIRRISKEKTLSEYSELDKYKFEVEALKAWVYEVKYSNWENSNDLKLKYGNASILSAKRVVFNIKGNDDRLVVDIEYKLKIVFIIWFGTHEECEIGRAYD